MSDDMAGSSATGGQPSIIGTDLRIRGDLESQGDLEVAGRVDGDISARSVTVKEGAVVSGNITAGTARICGRTEGRITATRVTLERSAQLSGDIVHEVLTVEAGAQLDGRCLPQGSAAAKAASLPPAQIGSGSGREG